MSKEYILSTLFYFIYIFFLQKQAYAGNHFTGSSRLLANIIRISGFLSSLLCLYYLIMCGIKVKWFAPIVMLPLGWVVYSIINRIVLIITCRPVLTSNTEMSEFDLWSLYNWRADIVSTVCAILGLIIIPITGYAMITLLNNA